MNKTSIGIDENVACFLCYLFGWISGVIIFLIEKDNTLVRFHAAQSIIVFGVMSMFQIVLGGGFFQLFSLAFIVLWIFLLIKAWNKEHFKLPIVGDIADQLSKKFKI